MLILAGVDNPFRSLNDNRWENNKNIVKLGFLPKEKYNLVLGSVDLCLLPLSDTLANQARYPGRIGDYMAAGRPTISNYVGDIGNIIKNNDLGILTNPDYRSFAQGIIKALRDPANLDKCGLNARNVAENKLSFDILSKDFESIYLQLLRGGLQT